MVADRISGTSNGLLKFVTLSDRTGFVETILFPDVYQRFGHLTAAHPILAASWPPPASSNPSRRVRVLPSESSRSGRRPSLRSEGAKPAKYESEHRASFAPAGTTFEEGGDEK
jgi:hypothetical protein